MPAGSAQGFFRVTALFGCWTVARGFGLIWVLLSLELFLGGLSFNTEVCPFPPPNHHTPNYRC